MSKVKVTGKEKNLNDQNDHWPIIHRWSAVNALFW